MEEQPQTQSTPETVTGILAKTFAPDYCGQAILVDTYEMVHQLSRIVRTLNLAKGFGAAVRPFPETAALIHSEISEALEADRTDAMDKKCPEYLGRDVELVDALVRILDYFGDEGRPDLGKVLEAVLEANAARPKMHGGKKY